MKTRLLIYISIVLLFATCKKEDDNTAPIIKVYAPIANSTYQVLDTIDISVLVTDDEIIKTIEIKLLDQSLHVIGSSLYGINKAEEELNVDYVIDNIYLASGDYFIKIIAKDEELTSTEFISIHITEHPLEWEGLLVIDANNNVNKLDISGNIQYQYTLPYTYSVADIDNEDGYLFTGVDEPNSISAINVSTGSQAWQEDISSLPISGYFNGMFYQKDTKLILASTINNDVLVYTSEGSQQGTISLGSGFEIRKIYSTVDRTYVYAHNLSLGANQLHVFYAQTSNIDDIQLIADDIVDIGSKSDGEIIVLSNTSTGGGVFSTYNVDLETLDPLNIFINNITGMEIISDAIIVISTDDALYRYNMNTNEVVLIESSYSPTDMNYDPVNNILFTSLASEIRYYQVSSWEQVSQVEIGSSVRGIFGVYNK